MTALDVSVRDDVDNHRYVIEVDGVLAGFAVYHLRGGRYFFVHTEVDESYSGRGFGTRLVQESLDDVGAKGAMIVPLCPFFAAYIEEHPEYGQMVDRGIMERINRND